MRHLLPCLLILSAGPALAAESGRACVFHDGGYVARVTLETAPAGSAAWRQEQRFTMAYRQMECASPVSQATRVRVTVEAFTGVSWLQACRIQLGAQERLTLTLKGGFLTPYCQRG